MTPDTRTATGFSEHEPGAARYLTVAGLAFLVVVMTLEPDVGFDAPPAARLLFWVMQISVGLFVLQLVLHLLTRSPGATHVPTWALVVSSGIVGALVLTPVYWLIGEGMMERWFGYAASPDGSDVAVTGFTVVDALLEEFVDIVGPVTAAWVLICLPRLHRLMPPLSYGRTKAAAAVFESAAGDPKNELSDVLVLDSGSPEASTHRPVESEPSLERQGSDAPGSTAPSVPQHPKWFERLPSEIGHDVIAVRSELQYLRVWTPRGHALILGSLAEVEAQASEEGLRVHRSWWVAARHVRSVRRASAGAVCLMSDGRQIPVSRRRRADVLARFGDGARYFVSAGSEAVAKADLN